MDDLSLPPTIRYKNTFSFDVLSSATEYCFECRLDMDFSLIMKLLREVAPCLRYMLLM